MKEFVLPCMYIFCLNFSSYILFLYLLAFVQNHHLLPTVYFIIFGEILFVLGSTNLHATLSHKKILHRNNCCHPLEFYLNSNLTFFIRKEWTPLLPTKGSSCWINSRNLEPKQVWKTLLLLLGWRRLYLLVSWNIVYYTCYLVLV